MTAIDHSQSNSQRTLQQMAMFWGDRARVKQDEFNPELVYDVEQDDFLDELIPLRGHPRFDEYYEDFRTQLLACGWLAYNEKTVDIESYIISPVCTDLIYGEIPGSQSEPIRWAASETLVDEGYHVLMVVNAMRACKKNRGLEQLKLRNFALTRNMYREMAQYEQPWQKQLVRLATSIVSEVFISDYLSQISEDHSIQPLNRYTTAMHKKDELAHSGLFRTFTTEIFYYLNAEQKHFFSSMLPKPVRWFASKELDVWHDILTFLQFPYTGEIIADCREDGTSDLSRIDYSELIQLASEVGILGTISGRDAFARENII